MYLRDGKKFRRQRHPDGRIKAYKVVTEEGWTCHKHARPIGKWFISNRKCIWLTLAEKCHGYVEKGIHCFLTRKAANSYKCRHEKVVTVAIADEDVVALGVNTAYEYPNIVAMKVEIVG